MEESIEIAEFVKFFYFNEGDKINLKEGELASPGMQVIALVNLDMIKFVGDISESYLPVIHKNERSM